VEPVLALTPHARHVLFECATGLDLRDLAGGRSVVIDRGADGQPASGGTSRAGLSDDGQTVLFCTRAKNIASNHGPDDDVIVHDLRRGTTAVVAHAGNSAGCVWAATVSGDGRTGLFGADAPGLVPADRRDPRQIDLFLAAPLR
jgi:hypothetical protein